MFIYLDEETGDVKVSPEGMQLSEVRELFATDKSTNKMLWRAWIKYIYWTYKRDNVFSNSFITERRNEVCSRFFPDKKPDYFENNPKIKAVIKTFVKSQYTHWERLLEKWKEDVDSYITYLTDVPYYRTVKDKDTKETSQVPNIDEKVKAQKAIQDLVETGTKIEQKIFQEKKEKSGKLNPIYDAG